jgi:hypothetical protein
MFDEFRLKYLTASSQTKAIAANYESALAAEMPRRRAVSGCGRTIR